MKIISVTQKACAPTYASLWCKTKKDTIMKFNFTNKGKDTTVNYMGAKAYKMTAWKWNSINRSHLRGR